MPSEHLFSICPRMHPSHAHPVLDLAHEHEDAGRPDGPDDPSLSPEMMPRASSLRFKRRILSVLFASISVVWLFETTIAAQSGEPIPSHREVAAASASTAGSAYIPVDSWIYSAALLLPRLPPDCVHWPAPVDARFAGTYAQPVPGFS